MFSYPIASTLLQKSGQNIMFSQTSLLKVNDNFACFYKVTNICPIIDYRTEHHSDEDLIVTEHHSDEDLIATEHHSDDEKI